RFSKRRIRRARNADGREPPHKLPLPPRKKQTGVAQHVSSAHSPNNFAVRRLRAWGCCPAFRHGTVFAEHPGIRAAADGGAPLASPTKLRLDDVSMAFATPGGTFQALANVSLVVPAGRFVSLIGPSGCGKSTIFNIVAGLLEPTEGRVMIDGEDATGTIGRVGYMLQKDLLLPWRTVLDNVILGMEIQGKPLREARERALPL